MNRSGGYLIFILLLLQPFTSFVMAQTEVMAWGNITGIRLDGELIDFESSLRVGNINGDMEITGKEKQIRPIYHRNNNSQQVVTKVRNVVFTQNVEDISDKYVKVDLKYKSDTTLNQPVYFCININGENYKDARISIRNKKISILSATRKLELQLDKSLKSFIKKEDDNSRTLYIMLASKIRRGGNGNASIDINIDGEIDNEDALINMDINNPGGLFVGLGGNFRLQNPKNDPKVIDYCLNNLRVAYGRVEFPWSKWQPEENINPMTDAVAGNLDKHVLESIEMAKRLKAMGMPVILSCWFPPRWAIEGDPDSYVRKGGVQAYRLDNDKKKKIYKSIADYIVYIKKYYGIEIDMFSFNESDLGIDVIFTPEEHCEFIKEFGAYLAGLNLPTKLLLGDNSDATTFDFILPALNDAKALPYIGAVSFHSWRGCDDETLIKWSNAAKKINVPLIIGEGSTDAAAYGYADIFKESTFALYEINLYMRICALCQPLSILQWQLTSDYSLLWGDGIYGSKGELRPTQRFWNLKQLASTPEQSLAIPVTASKKNINAAAFANIVRGEYAIHIVNNGAGCKATINGLPHDIKSAKAYTTNSRYSMEESTLDISNGNVEVYLPDVSFVTIILE